MNYILGYAFNKKQLIFISRKIVEMINEHKMEKVQDMPLEIFIRKNLTQLK